MHQRRSFGMSFNSTFKSDEFDCVSATFAKRRASRQSTSSWSANCSGVIESGCC